jgi:heme/copper-type cytochrome/quinol oxidase subunit 4
MSEFMEAPEVPIEQTQEDIHHHAHQSKEKWTMGVALSSALLAALAAVSSLMAGHHSNEAMIDQIRSSDQWSHYQAKSIKANVLGAKLEMLKAVGKPSNEKDQEKLTEYKNEQEDIKRQAEEKEQASERHLHSHVIFARAVTMFQVAIAVAAISVLTQRRRFWFISLAFGLVGAAFLLQGFFAH